MTASRRDPLGATAALVVGLLGLVIGIGIGLRRMSVSGVDPVAVLGLLCLVGGAAATGWGAYRLVRLVPGWWKLLAVPAALAVLAFVAWPLTVALMVTSVPPIDLGDETPADRGLDHETVTFTTADGVELAGWYLPSENGAAVVLRHGATSTRADVLDQAEVLAAAGYGVLLTDARGHGESGGRAMDLGWYGDQDVTAAVAYLAVRPDVDPDRIGAIGMSMGGEEVIGAAAADPRIHAVVAEGATGRTRDDTWGWLPSGPLGWIQRGIDVVQYALIDLLTPASPPISLRDAVAEAAPTPVLLIVAGEEGDEDVAAESIRERSPATVEIWEVPGASHTGGLDAAPQEWRERVIGFLDAALTRPPA